MDYIMKIVKSHEESGLLIKGIREIIKNEANNKKEIYYKSRNEIFKHILRRGNKNREGAISKSWGRGTIRAGQKF